MTLIEPRPPAPATYPKKRPTGRRKSLPSKFVSSFRAEGIAGEFTDLADRWEDDTRLVASVQAMVDHDAYRRIIQLGPRVVPLILRRMKDGRRYWFPALVRITHQNPASETDTVDGAIEAWLRWADEQGIAY